MRVGGIVVVAVQHHLDTVAAHRINLDLRVVRGITITALVPSRLAASATPWAWLPAEAATTPLRSCAGAARPSCCSTTALEREHRLLVLALEEHGVAGAARQDRGVFERRFARHIVDPGVEDAFQYFWASGGLPVRARPDLAAFDRLIYQTILLMYPAAVS